MKTLVLSILFTLFYFGTALQAKEFHVSPDGNNKNRGAAGEPLKTIQAAANLAMPGDVIIVHEGVYREWVNPPRGGKSDIERITYKAADGEKVVIKGSEMINNWEPVNKNVWKITMPNSFFGSYNPYAVLLEGDWFNNKGINHHTGDVYLNGVSLFEKNSLEEVMNPVRYEDARFVDESIYVWYAEADDDHTTIWANFQDANPNQQRVEINVRPNCFYPTMPGRDYITIDGFEMTQAATQWAAPTAEQPGLIGTHWSKGWIIENNTISNSKCVGIALGKERATGQDVWMNNRVKDGATHYNEVIFRALEIGWSKEKIGSHVVRNNTIYRCGQAGIVGSLGAVFSQICNNHIYDVWVKRDFTGAEMAGIKIHASIDMLIRNNRIHNTGRGIWIDWMAQGTRISQNLLYDNTTDDLFTEVNHGPFLIDNNILLSEIAIMDMSEGGAYVHNLMGGKIKLRQVLNRFTPYHLPHSTKVAGVRNIYNGDNRFYNNIFVKGVGEEISPREDEFHFHGLDGYRHAGFKNKIDGNAYYLGAKPAENEANFIEAADFNPQIRIREDGDNVYLHFSHESAIRELKTQRITTQLLGTTLVSECIFEQPDGTPYIIDIDYFGDSRDDTPTAGPFETLNKEVYQVW